MKMELDKYIDSLEAEVKIYRDAAALYGIDAITMLTLAKSQIKTCANNIRLTEQMEEMRGFFSEVQEGTTPETVLRAMEHYDGDGSKPYCDLVWAGLRAIYKYLRFSAAGNAG